MAAGGKTIHACNELKCDNNRRVEGKQMCRFALHTKHLAFPPCAPALRICCPS